MLFATPVVSYEYGNEFVFYGLATLNVRASELLHPFGPRTELLWPLPACRLPLDRVRGSGVALPAGDQGEEARGPPRGEGEAPGGEAARKPERSCARPGGSASVRDSARFGEVFA